MAPYSIVYPKDKTTIHSIRLFIPHVTIPVYLTHLRTREDGAAVAGDCHLPRPLAHAAELPSAGQVAQRVGESVGEINEALTRF